MALINTKRSALFLVQGQNLPVPPANFIETNTPLIVVPQSATVETNRLSGQMNSADSVVDTCRSATSFLASADIRSTQGDTPAEYNELLKVSGFKETINANNVLLENETAYIDRGSAYVYMDGKRFDFTHTLVGDSEIVLNVGEIGRVNTTLSGYIDDPKATDDPNPAVTLNQNNVIIVSCVDIVTRDGVVIPAEGVTFSTNPQITNLYTMGGASGIKADEITDYALTCEIRFPVDSAVFGHDASMIEAGTIESINVVIGADASGQPVNGQSVVFNCDAAKAVVYNDEIENDVLRRVTTLRLYDNGAQSALSITTGDFA